MGRRIIVVCTDGAGWPPEYRLNDLNSVALMPYCLGHAFIPRFVLHILWTTGMPTAAGVQSHFVPCQRVDHVKTAPIAQYFGALADK